MTTIIVQIDNDKGDGKFVQAFADLAAAEKHLRSKDGDPNRPIKTMGRDSISMFNGWTELIDPAPYRYFPMAVRVFAADTLYVSYRDGIEVDRDVEKYEDIDEGGIYFLEVEI